VAMERLAAYRWPGNVRELENVIERAVILSPGPTLEPDALCLTGPGEERSGGVRNRRAVVTLAAADREAILSALAATSWRISGRGGAADRLGVKPTTLHAKMRKLGIRRHGPRPVLIDRTPDEAA
jgi:formate hydrogenlyase transcriptional activator